MATDEVLGEEDILKLLIPENWDIEIALEPEPHFFMLAEHAYLDVP